jgi:hypothetical protein
MEELKLYFSLISGELYYIEPDEVKNLDNNQIPLVKKPNSKCKQCYGRFYTGFEVTKKYYVPCPKCMKKCIDWDIQPESVDVSTTKTTNEIADNEFINEVERAGM